MRILNLTGTLLSRLNTLPSYCFIPRSLSLTLCRKPLIRTPASETSATSEELTIKPTLRTDIYPDPGYLGSSSSNAVFEEIQGHIVVHSQNVLNTFDGFSKDEAARAELLMKSDSSKIKAGIGMLETLCCTNHFGLFETLALKYRSRENSCSLIGPIFGGCFQSVKRLAQHMERSKDINADLLKWSSRILANTLRPMRFDGSTSYEAFMDQFTGDNMRWETVGLVFVVYVSSHIAFSLFSSTTSLNCK